MDESLREKWTEETVMRIYVNGGGEPSGFNKGFKAIADAHNTTLPHDCGETASHKATRSADTKRLDWLEDWLEKVKWDDYATVREAIDVAMSETRRGEKSQT